MLRVVLEVEMSERFNSGAGGYTCDSCHTLLWAGVSALHRPEHRMYCYNETEDSITIDNKGNTYYAYCSKCKEESKDEQ